MWKPLEGGIFDLYELVPGSTLAVIAIVVVSLMTSEPEPAATEKFDDMIKTLNQR
ncbi:MAG: hypothetical protein P8Y45_18855 [Exilibacterium sp.]